MLSEARRGERKIGTTSRGIGPAYEDKIGRRGIRVVRSARRPRGAGRGSARERQRAQPDHQGFHARLEAGARPDRAAAASGMRPWVADVVAVSCTGDAQRGQGGDVRRRAGHAARHRSRHLSVRDLVERVDRRRLHRPRRAGRARSAACSAWPRRTRRAWARGRCRPSCPASWPTGCARAARSTARPPAARAAAAGTTPSSSATRRASTGSTRSRSPSSTCSTGLPEVLMCTGYKTAQRARHRVSGRPASAASARARLRARCPDGRRRRRASQRFDDLPAEAQRYFDGSKR